LADGLRVHARQLLAAFPAKADQTVKVEAGRDAQLIQPAALIDHPFLALDIARVDGSEAQLFAHPGIVGNIQGFAAAL
jgi:hypothetical protein